MLHRSVYAVAIASLPYHWWPLASRCHLADRFAPVIVPSLLLRVVWSRRGAIARGAYAAGEPALSGASDDSDAAAFASAGLTALFQRVR